MDFATNGNRESVWERDISNKSGVVVGDWEQARSRTHKAIIFISGS
jgi:hypothetical protein